MQTQGQPSGASGQLGKDQILPCTEYLFSQDGVGLGQTHITSLNQNRAQPMLNCLNSFKSRRAVPLKQFQRLLGHMASAAAVTLFKLLHIRPLQCWLHDLRWAWHGCSGHSQNRPATKPSSPCLDLAFLWAGVPLVQESRHVVSTDTSAIGWGAMCNGHAASGSRTRPQLQWHITG